MSTSVLVLGGGPDAERSVSLESAAGVAAALRTAGGFEVHERTIDRPSAEDLRAMPGQVVFPVLHGPWGEGGALQDLLVADGRPFVGCGPRAARLAMDKIATKLMAAREGVPTAEACILNAADPACALAPPLVAKPVFEGSSVGLHVCRDAAAWHAARRSIADDLRAHPHRVYLAERLITGRELTVAVLDGQALPIVEIVPAEGVYDFAAKYQRDDTRYVVAPDLPAGASGRLAEHAVRVARALGVRHLCRVDFLLDAEGVGWMLEANTLPGFTSHSLFPLAAGRAGMAMPALCARLVALALRDGSAGPDLANPAPSGR